MRQGAERTWPAYAAAVYALVSFYWAFGGTAGVGTLGGRLEEMARSGDPAVLWLAGVAGVLKLAGAVLALAPVRPGGAAAAATGGGVGRGGAAGGGRLAVRAGRPQGFGCCPGWRACSRRVRAERALAET
ncbi:MAG TPA: DUF3995 domain-containing protein [Actinomycetota bacterium]|nr:DUF3995 domain-containing protein [Actinomycetota bacterium]